MTRLVSSRIHRCYSRSGGQRSARNERLTDILHVCSCLLVLFKRNAAFFKTLASEIAQVTGELGTILFLLTNVIDLYASITAHRMFYKWPKSGRQSESFLSNPTRVDGLISFFYVCAGILGTVMTMPIAKTFQNASRTHEQLVSAFAILGGAVVNTVASLPSLDFLVPAPMARVHNCVVMLFLMGAMTRVCSALLTAVPLLKTADLQRIQLWFSVVSDVLILCGAVLNFLRVTQLLRKVHHWMNDDSKNDGTRSRRGILSWFKASRSSNEMSDVDSDFEDQGMDSDDENPIQSRRKPGWTRT